MAKNLLNMVQMTRVLHRTIALTQKNNFYLVKVLHGHQSPSQTVIHRNLNFARTSIPSLRLFSSSDISKSKNLESDVSDSDTDSEEYEDDDEFVKKFLDPKDRSRVISPELSIKYMESTAYKTTYGDEPIWTHYRRAYDGRKGYKGRPPLKTRETCIRQGKVQVGSPCPICRDEYIVVDYRNIALLNQFLDDYTGKLLHPNRTGICQKQWRRLEIAVEKATDYGFLDLDVPFIKYDLEEYKPKE